MCVCEQSSGISLSIRSRDLLGKNDTENMQLYQTSHFLLESDSNPQFNCPDAELSSQNCGLHCSVLRECMHITRFISYNSSTTIVPATELRSLKGLLLFLCQPISRPEPHAKSSCWRSPYLTAGSYGKSVSSACSASPLSHSYVLLGSSHIMHYSWGEKKNSQ